MPSKKTAKKPAPKIQVKERPRVLVGIPHTYSIAAATTQSLLAMFRHTTEVGTLALEMIGGSYHHTARNGLAWRMLHNTTNYTHLLFIDSDIIFPEEGLDMLIKSNKDIVGALVHQKAPPFPPCSLMRVEQEFCPKHNQTHYGYMRHMRSDEIRGKGLLEVGNLGYGFTLFKRDVFESKVPYPWFSLPANEDAGAYGHWDISMVGEDVYFSQKATKNGVKMYVNRDLKCGHFGLMTFDYSIWDLYDKTYAPSPRLMKQWERERAKQVKNKEICIIGLEGDINAGDKREASS